VARDSRCAPVPWKSGFGTFEVKFTTMVMRMKDAGVPLVRLSLYQGTGHVETMTRAGREPDLWPWTFSQFRKTPSAPAAQ
jgi:hypothetical protein